MDTSDLDTGWGYHLDYCVILHSSSKFMLSYYRQSTMYKVSVCVVNMICVLHHDRFLRIIVTFLFRVISMEGGRGVAELQ